MKNKKKKKKKKRRRRRKKRRESRRRSRKRKRRKSRKKSKRKRRKKSRKRRRRKKTREKKDNITEMKIDVVNEDIIIENVNSSSVSSGISRNKCLGCNITLFILEDCLQSVICVNCTKFIHLKCDFIPNAKIFNDCSEYKVCCVICIFL
jgi:hypothetical protein